MCADFGKIALDSDKFLVIAFVSAIIDGAKVPTGSSVDAAYLGNVHKWVSTLHKEVSMVESWLQDFNSRYSRYQQC